MKIQKTNVMRELERAAVPYEAYSYPSVTALSATEVARALELPAEQIYKTLVTVAKSGAHYVFVIPGPQELDLKKAASASGEKSIAMLPQKDLLKLTGYVHGGCSPIGMKTPFPCTIDESAILLPRIVVSAGKIGSQVALAAEDLARLIGANFADLSR